MAWDAIGMCIMYGMVVWYDMLYGMVWHGDRFRPAAYLSLPLLLLLIRHPVLEGHLVACFLVLPNLRLR
jgi:hypothetical protein